MNKEIIKEFEEWMSLNRPYWEDIKISEYIRCSCGQTLQTVENTRKHWQMGHFDTKKDIKPFLKAKLNQVIDEMIGEERETSYHDPRWLTKSQEDIGYNQKVQELKEYKKKFNKLTQWSKGTVEGTRKDIIAKLKS